MVAWAVTLCPSLLRSLKYTRCLTQTLLGRCYLGGRCRSLLLQLTQSCQIALSLFLMSLGAAKVCLPCQSLLLRATLLQVLQIELRRLQCGFRRSQTSG